MQPHEADFQPGCSAKVGYLHCTGHSAEPRPMAGLAETQPFRLPGQLVVQARAAYLVSFRQSHGGVGFVTDQRPTRLSFAINSACS
jgi:hypothetical protein